MPQNKKILFILPTIPYPLSIGGNQAMYNGICAVKDEYEVHVIYIDPLHNSNKKQKEVLEKLSNKTILLVPFKFNPFKIGKKDKSYQFDLLVEKYKPISQEYIDFIKSYIDKNKIDLVQFEMISCLSMAVSLSPDTKKIFVHHELGYVVNEQKMLVSGVTEYKNANVELAKILEIGLLNKCDAVITLSEIDKQKLMDNGVKAPVYSSFAVVNTEASSNNPNELGNVLSFVGPAKHTPNYVGLKWFLENCWNALLEKDSSYVLKIIGNWPEEKRNEIKQKYKNIEFLGFVPNLADALSNTIMIVPITVGSGIRMKILEAASLGIPFVSTSVGAEGLPFENGRDCLKGDTPIEFVDSIEKMKDKFLREMLVKNANELVKERYSMDALKKNRLEIYDRVLNNTH